MRKHEAAEQSSEMVDLFLSLSTAAITLSTLAPELNAVDLYVELSEQALDQASIMSTLAATERVKSPNTIANLVARAQLASGESSLEMLGHTFALGVELDEDDFRALLQDMALLSNECRQRAAKLKGHKGAVVSTLAWESLRQLVDAKIIYANMLRWVWRQRKPRRNGHTKTESPGSFGMPSRNHDTRENVGQAIKEEGEGDIEPHPFPVKRGSVSQSQAPSSRRLSNSSSNDSDGLDAAHRKGSNPLTAVSEDAELSSFRNSSPLQVICHVHPYSRPSKRLASFTYKYGCFPYPPQVVTLFFS